MANWDLEIWILKEIRLELGQFLFHFLFLSWQNMVGIYWVIPTSNGDYPMFWKLWSQEDVHASRFYSKTTTCFSDTAWNSPRVSFHMLVARWQISPNTSPGQHNTVRSPMKSPQFVPTMWLDSLVSRKCQVFPRVSTPDKGMALKMLALLKKPWGFGVM